MVTEQELKKLISWTAEYLNTVAEGRKGRYNAIVGLSGGIDSSVIASLCVKAVGKENVLGVIMPCDSNPQDENLAYDLADSLDISCINFGLERIFYEFKMGLKNGICPQKPIDKLVYGNIKARLRMTTLYAVAGYYGGLVAGTTNKTEAILGYATKYGDNGVDIEPMLEFYKKEVYELAKLLGDIPEEIINRAPTAGLWDGQTDEGELGIPYATIDGYLMDMGIEKMCEYNHEEVGPNPVIKKIVQLYKAGLHKDFHLPHFKRI